MRLTLARSEGARRLGIVIAVLVGIAGLLPSWLVLEQTGKEFGLYHSFMQLRKDGKLLARFVDRSRSPSDNPITCSDASAPEHRIFMVTDEDSRYIVTLESKIGRPSTAKEWGAALQEGIVQGYAQTSGKPARQPTATTCPKTWSSKSLVEESAPSIYRTAVSRLH